MRALVVAKAENNVIGKNNDLPWYLPADLRHFKEITTDHTVIMGRKTYESIVARINGPLPNRRNIVVSRSVNEFPEGFEGAQSLIDALRMSESDAKVFIIGGSSLYEEALEKGFLDTMFITEVHAEIDGDVYFPEFDLDAWQESERISNDSDEKNDFDYDFVTYKKIL